MRHVFLLRLVLFASILSLISCGPQDPSADTPFLKAVKTNDLAGMEQQLVQEPALLNRATEVERLTPLHLAARYADPETVAWLIEQGAEVNAQDHKGMTALHWSAHSLRSRDATPLRLLLEAGADYTLENAKGLDPWEYMLNRHPNSLWGQSSIALGFLLRYGYEPDLMVNEEEGKTILHELAERCEAPEAIEHLITEHKLAINATDANGWTPLHFAAAKQNYVAAEVLLRHGADINAKTIEGVGIRGSSPTGEGIEGKRKYRYQYPAGSTPEALYKRRGRGSRSGKNLGPLFEAYQ